MESEARAPECDRREDSERKPYSTPRIDDFGALIEITHAGSGAVEDSGVLAFSGSGG